MKRQSVSTAVHPRFSISLPVALELYSLRGGNFSSTDKGLQKSRSVCEARKVSCAAGERSENTASLNHTKSILPTGILELVAPTAQSPGIAGSASRMNLRCTHDGGFLSPQRSI